MAAACGQLAGTIAEGKTPADIVPLDGTTVVETWSGSWRTTTEAAKPALLFEQNWQETAAAAAAAAPAGPSSGTTAAL